MQLSSLEQELADPDSLRSRVLDGILKLLRIRASEPAFHPDSKQKVLFLNPESFSLRRVASDGSMVLALHNVSENRITMNLPQRGALNCLQNLLTGEVSEASETITLEPYQVAWLKPV